MEHPSQQRPSQQRPSRELTLAEVLDPRTFTRSRRRFKAIRDCALYALQASEIAPDLLVALDRNYRPLGAQVPSGQRVEYRKFPAHHCRVDQVDLDAGPGDGTRWLSSPAHAAGRSFWFWSDRTAPYATAAGLARYRLALLDVLGLDGLAWIARLAGRDLGHFPSRAECWAGLLAEMDAGASAPLRDCPPAPMFHGAPEHRRPERRAVRASGAEQKAGDDCREASGVGRREMDSASELPRQLEVGGALPARVVAMPAPPNSERPLLNSYETTWLARLAAESGTPPDRIVRTAVYVYLRRKAPHLDPKLRDGERGGGES